MAEVTIGDYIEFLSEQQFNAQLFPQLHNEWYRLLFEDLKKGKDFTYVKEGEVRGPMKTISPRRFLLTKEAKELDENINANLNLPITGISYEQALAYCAWKEEYINKAQDNKIRYIHKVGLPSASMFNELIPNIDSVCRKKCKPCENMTFNYRVDACCDGKTEKQRVAPMVVDAFMPNMKGAYGVQGNVAEMTDVKGIAKGGSYKHYAIDSYRDAVQHYDGPQDWLGFRIIVTLDGY